MKTTDPPVPGHGGGVVLSIQYLRGLAAVAVALTHLVGRAELHLETTAAGVDVFFVISGFIMWTVTAGREVPPGRFLLDRLTRIVPLYVLLTFAVYLVAILVPAAFPNMRTSLSHAVLSALFIPHTSPAGTPYPQIAPGWTLNIEVFFYLVVAAGLWLGLSEQRRLWTYTAGLGLLALIGLLTRSDVVAVNSYTSPLLLEFVAGLWLGVAWQRGLLPRAAWGWAALLAALAALTAWELADGTQAIEVRVLVWGVPSVLIVGGMLTLERRLGMPRWRLGLLLGSASYSIYLLNVLAVGATWRLVGWAPLPVYYAAATLASAAAGIVLWWLVERPLSSAVRRWFHRPAPMASAAWDVAPGATAPAAAPRGG